MGGGARLGADFAPLPTCATTGCAGPSFGTLPVEGRVSGAQPLALSIDRGTLPVVDCGVIGPRCLCLAAHSVLTMVAVEIGATNCTGAVAE